MALAAAGPAIKILSSGYLLYTSVSDTVECGGRLKNQEEDPNWKERLEIIFRIVTNVADAAVFAGGVVDGVTTGMKFHASKLSSTSMEVAKEAKKIKDLTKIGDISRVTGAGVGTVSFTSAELCQGKGVKDILKEGKAVGRALTTAGVAGDMIGGKAKEVVSLASNVVKIAPFIIDLLTNLVNKYIDTVNATPPVDPTLFPFPRNVKELKHFRLTPPPRDMNYRDIPLEYEEDEVFSKYDCPIGLAPIRFPVRWTGGERTHYFELKNIGDYCKGDLEATHKHPLTGAEISLKDFEICIPELIEIETRLRQLDLPLT